MSVLLPTSKCECGARFDFDSPTRSLSPLFAALILFLEWLTFFLGTAFRNPSHCRGPVSS